VERAEQPDPRLAEFVERLAEALAAEYLRTLPKPQSEDTAP
jgi:hypothetical protein